MLQHTGVPRRGTPVRTGILSSILLGHTARRRRRLRCGRRRWGASRRRLLRPSATRPWSVPARSRSPRAARTRSIARTIAVSIGVSAPRTVPVRPMNSRTNAGHDSTNQQQRRQNSHHSPLLNLRTTPPLGASAKVTLAMTLRAATTTNQRLFRRARSGSRTVFRRRRRRRGCCAVRPLTTERRPRPSPTSATAVGSASHRMHRPMAAAGGHAPAWPSPDTDEHECAERREQNSEHVRTSRFAVVAATSRRHQPNLLN